jgi:SOS regulatory protein LexA
MEYKNLHIKQQLILSMLESGKDLGNMTLRGIADDIGAPGRPQIAKHHLEQLKKRGLIQMNLKENFIKLVKTGYNKPVASTLYSLPVVGTANCGAPTIFAEENIEKYLKVSSKMLPRNKKNLYILVADGNSMNEAVVNDKKIEDGDFVLVDSSYKDYKNGDIVVAVIDGLATIKEFTKKGDEIVLKPRSTDKDHLPVYIHQDDEFGFNGKVVGIIKS